MTSTKNRVLAIIIVILAAVPLLLQAQYKQNIPTIPGLTNSHNNEVSSVLGIDLSRINFHNSYSMQINSMGGNAVAMGLLKSSFDYVINPQVSVRGFVGLIHSPFSSITPTNEQYSFINGFNEDNILYGGEITYHPKENMFFHIGFSKTPSNNFNQLYSPDFYRPQGY